MFSFNTRLYVNKQRISADGSVSLYLMVYISRPGIHEKHPFPLMIRWPLHKIDLKANRLKSRFKDDPDVNDYNLMILSEMNKHNEAAKRFRLTGKVINMDAFRREMRVIDYSKNLVGYMLYMRKERFVAKEIEEQTYKNHGSTVESIVQFGMKCGLSSNFDQVSLKWMNRYKRFLLDEGLKVLTIWTRIRDVKSYLNLAAKEKTIYVDQEAADFSNPEPETETVYLDHDELKRFMQIYDPGSFSEIEINVWKGFLFTCFTSLRISDLYRAGADWLYLDDFLLFTPKKNGKRNPKYLQIPLVPIAKQLIDLTTEKFFELPSEQEYNRTLKDLAKRAGIKKNLTSHVGRHTFGFLYMEQTNDIYGLKKILGHKKLETTMRYAHISKQYKLRQAMKIQSGLDERLQRAVNGPLKRSQTILSIRN
ncbi:MULTISPECIES: site-specific integrase [Olivibacter]|uniref:Site-specific integrase n=1 Tax=Olivibacter jilunii TaxID=985016 RepID=A0ABW6AZI3_9SPHI